MRHETISPLEKTRSDLTLILGNAKATKEKNEDLFSDYKAKINQ